MFYFEHEGDLLFPLLCQCWIVMILVCMLVCVVLSRHTEIHHKCKILITSRWVFGWMVCFVSPTAIFFLMKPFLVCFHLTAMFWSSVGRYCLHSWHVLLLPEARTEFRKEAYEFAAPSDFNQLHNHLNLRELLSLNDFKDIWSDLEAIALTMICSDVLRCLSFEVHNISLDLLCVLWSM